MAIDIQYRYESMSENQIVHFGDRVVELSKKTDLKCTYIAILRAKNNIIKLISQAKINVL